MNCIESGKYSVDNLNEGIASAPESIQGTPAITTDITYCGENISRQDDPTIMTKEN